MNRTKKFMYNTLSTAIYQIVVMLVGFVTPRILLQYYGSEINGLVSSINQFITYFSLVEAGIAGAAVYSLYKPLANKNHEEISSIVSAAKKFYVQAGFIFTLLVLGMALIYPLFVTAQNLNSVLMAVLVIVLGAKGFLDFFTLAKYRVILTADQKTYIISNASTVYVLLQMVIIVIMSILKCNIVFVYAVAILALFARSIILMVYVKKKYPYINYKAEPNKKALDKRWDALFLQILQTVQTGAPVVIATIFTSLKDVSVYSIFNMVLVGINGVLNIFMSGLSASFGDIIARKEKENLKVVYKDFEYTYYLLISLVYAVSFALIMSFIRIYTADITDANYNQPLIGILFVLNGLLYNIKTPQGTLVIAAGLYKETRWRTLLQALIIVVFGSILAPKFGIVGILIASCLSNLYRDIDLLFFVPKNVTKTKVIETFKNWVMLVLIVIMIVLPGIVFDINPTTFGTWILIAIPYTIYAAIVVVLLGGIFNKCQFLAVLKRIKRMVVKKNESV